MRTIALLALLGACRGTTDDTSDALDVDGDGVPASEDCNDADATAYPGATEVCDGVDNDCDGAVDDEASDATTFYGDGDGDGYGDAGAAAIACDAPADHVTDGTDCDDADPAVHPGAAEDDCADPTDYNCDGASGFTDGDGDGAPACEDCDDADASAHPGGTEACDGVDNDCDGVVDDEVASTFYADADADGYGDPATAVSACEAPEGHVTDATDCDDADPTANPAGTEACGGGDEDCDGETDEAGAAGETAYYADGDADGYGSGDPVTSCSPLDGHATAAGDCDDASAAANPGATEACGGGDEDCDGETDESGASGEATFYADADGDAHGDPDTSVQACAAPTGHVSSSDDCDDGSAAVYAGATETCDDVDQDCDGEARDADAADAKTFYEDADGDGYGKDSVTEAACDAPTGFADADGDCDDAAPDINPGAAEACNGKDNDCDGTVDAEVSLGAFEACAGKTCKDVLATRSDTVESGLYWVDPSGSDAFEAWCDMTTEGGGWTRVANLYAGDRTIASIKRNTRFFYSAWLQGTSSFTASTNDGVQLEDETYGMLDARPFFSVAKEVRISCDDTTRKLKADAIWKPNVLELAAFANSIVYSSTPATVSLSKNGSGYGPATVYPTNSEDRYFGSWHICGAGGGATGGFQVGFCATNPSTGDTGITGANQLALGWHAGYAGLRLECTADSPSNSSIIQGTWSAWVR